MGEKKETVRREAHRLDLSISEVRRRRHGHPARTQHGGCPCGKHAPVTEKEAAE
jgi:Mn-dependent DtxR family transcriptional regulator